MKTLTNTKKRFLIATGVAAAMAITGAAFADRPHRGPGGRGGGFAHRLMGMVHQLDLTEEQEIKAVKLRRQFREEQKATKVDRKAMKQTLATELAKANPDAQKIHGIADQALARMTKMTHSMIDKFLELHATFTPEQRKQLGEAIQKRGGHEGGRRMRGGK